MRKSRMLASEFRRIPVCNYRRHLLMSIRSSRQVSSRSMKPLQNPPWAPGSSCDVLPRPRRPLESALWALKVFEKCSLGAEGLWKVLSGRWRPLENAFWALKAFGKCFMGAPKAFGKSFLGAESLRALFSGRQRPWKVCSERRKFLKSVFLAPMPLRTIFWLPKPLTSFSWQSKASKSFSGCPRIVLTDFVSWLWYSCFLALQNCQMILIM